MCVCKMEYSSSTKMAKIRQLERKWVELETFILSDIRHTQNSSIKCFFIHEKPIKINCGYFKKERWHKIRKEA